MKKNIILLLIFMCCWLVNVCLYAQEKSSSTLDLLQNKNWVMWFPSEKEYTCIQKFSSDTCISILSYNGENVEIKEKYCLSNTPDVDISPSKREKLKKGKYIIRENQGEIKAYEILKLTPDSLILKNLDNSSILTYFSKVKR